MSDLIERLRERSISWERAEHDKLQDYWMDAVKDGHLAADALEAKDSRIAELEAKLTTWQGHTESLLLERIAELEKANAELNHKVGEYVDKTAELEGDNERLRAAIAWALGYTDFGRHKPDNAPPFWWRKELRERSGITHDEALAAVEGKNTSESRPIVDKSTAG